MTQREQFDAWRRTRPNGEIFESAIHPAWLAWQAAITQGRAIAELEREIAKLEREIDALENEIVEGEEYRDL
jgi:hypothetical protein